MASCSNCGAGLSGQFCARCGADNETAIGEPTGPSTAERTNAVRAAGQRHGVPALISFFIPGLGQLIKGDWLSGLFFFLAGVFGGALCLAGVGFIVLPIVWVWNLYDAYVSPDGQTKRELKRLAKLVVVLACGLGIVGCGSVTAADPPADGGMGGTTATGGIGADGSLGAGGTAVAQTGGAPGTGGAGGQASSGLGGAAAAGTGGFDPCSSAILVFCKGVCADSHGECLPVGGSGGSQ